MDKSLFYRGKNEPFRLRGVHRGGGFERVEHTLAAFKNAHDQGCNLMELDVFITKDDIVVLNHDDSLERMTGVDAPFEEYNFADLPPLKKYIEYKNDVGGYTQQEGLDDA